MAITNHRIVTGIAGGENGIVNVGSGADVTWPTAGNPSLALSGLYYTNAEGSTLTQGPNLTTASDRGTHYAWGAQGDGDTKPSWATGPGYIEIPAAATNTRVQFISAADLNALSAASWDDGFDVTVGIQFAINGTYNPGTVPQNNNTAVAIMRGSADSAEHTQVRVQSRNVEGYAPGIDFGFGAYTGTYTSCGIDGSTGNSGSSSDPQTVLRYNTWYKLRVRWVRSGSAVANTGRVMVWIGDVLICNQTGADTWFTTADRMGSLAGLLHGYTAAITGCKIRYCPPIMVRTVPDADLVPEGDWAINTAEDNDIRRFYNCMVSGAGAAWTFSGTATLPSVGTKYSTSGVNPLRRRFVIAGTAAQTFTMLLNKFVWTGGDADNPKGEDGRVWYRFTDIYGANNCNISLSIEGNASTTTLHTIALNMPAGTFVVDGVTLATGVQASTRFEILVGIGTSNTVVILNDTTTTSKAATALRRYIVTTFAGTARWDGTQLGVISAVGTYGGSVSAEIGPVVIMPRCRVVECDSFASAAANGASPNLACTANHIGLYLTNAEDRIVAGGYDPIPQTGGKSGLAVGLTLARSGARLSESETHYWDDLTGFAWHGLILGGVINDVSAATATVPAADAAAETIADRMVRWADLAVASGGTATFFEAINAASGSATGSYNNVSMGIPGLVWTKLPDKLRAKGYGRGKVFYPDDAMKYVVGNATSADGIHPSSGGSRNIMLVNHRAFVDVADRTGFNNDGSMGREKSAETRYSAYIRA